MAGAVPARSPGHFRRGAVEYLRRGRCPPRAGPRRHLLLCRAISPAAGPYPKAASAVEDRDTHPRGEPMTTIIREADLIESVADALQFISYYHPMDYIRALGVAYEAEQSPAAKDAIAQILTNSRMCAEGHR